MAFTSRYLQAKQTLDSHSRSKEGSQGFIQLADQLYQTQGHLKILELGAGTGAFPDHFPLPWERIEEYQMLEPDPDLASRARLRWAGESKPIFVREQTLEELWKGGRIRSNIIMGHAFLDLFSPQDFFSRLKENSETGTLFYFTLVFDGMSFFLPQEPEDEQWISIYHRSMKEEKGRDGARTGRLAFGALEALDYEFQAWPSAWQVRPGQGMDPEQRGDFLFGLLGFFEQTFQKEKPSGHWQSWIERKRKLILEDRLGFLASYWDFLGRVP